MDFKKKSTPASNLTPILNRPAETARPFKAPATQLKTRTSAQSINHPIAPPVYRPQATPKVAQPKMANGAVNRGSPIAPPVYRPNFSGAVQQTPARAVQFTKKCKVCNSKSHGTSQHEYYAGKSKANPQSQAAQISKNQRTLNAFQSYRSDFFDEYTITTAHIDLFFKAGYTLHGHGSGGNGDGENQATVDDANAFVGWYRGKYLQ